LENDEEIKRLFFPVLGQSFKAAFGINETLRELFEKARINFKCGFPKHG
jgi:hypothetical protein